MSPVIDVMSASEIEPTPAVVPIRSRPSDVRYAGSSLKLMCMLPRIVSSVPSWRWRARNRSRPSVYSVVFASAGLHPEERPVEAGVGLRPEELAVEVDADLESRVAGHDLNGGRAAD